MSSCLSADFKTLDVVQKFSMVLNCLVPINIAASYFEMKVLLAVWSPT